MKHRKVILLLSIVISISGINSIAIQAEEDVLTENESGIIISDENDSLQDKLEDREELFFMDEEQPADASDDWDLILEASEDNSDTGIDDIFLEQEEQMDTGDQEQELEEMLAMADVLAAPADPHNLNNYYANLDDNKLISGNDFEEELHVYQIDGDTMISLKPENYEILGFVSKADFEEANHSLDDISSFSEKPDEEGEWYLIFSGITPYYGRQAICVEVYDKHDLAVWEWEVDNNLIPGDDIMSSLRMFWKGKQERRYLDKQEYEIAGYLKNDDQDGNAQELTDMHALIEYPNETGDWIIVLKGKGEHKGTNIAYITINDSYDLSNYECTILSDGIKVNEDITSMITVSRNMYNNHTVLGLDDYQVAGFVTDAEFSECGYNPARLDTVHSAMDEPGGWYVILEGKNSYYGTIIQWFQVDPVMDEDIDIQSDEISGEMETEPEIILES